MFAASPSFLCPFPLHKSDFEGCFKGMSAGPTRAHQSPFLITFPITPKLFLWVSCTLGTLMHTGEDRRRVKRTEEERGEEERRQRRRERKRTRGQWRKGGERTTKERTCKQRADDRTEERREEKRRRGQERREERERE